MSIVKPVLLDRYGAVIAAKMKGTEQYARFYTLSYNPPVKEVSLARVDRLYTTLDDGSAKLIGAQRVDQVTKAYEFYCVSEELVGADTLYDCTLASNYTDGDGSFSNPWKNFQYALEQISCLQRTTCCGMRICLNLSGIVNYRVVGGGTCTDSSMLIIHASSCVFDVSPQTLSHSVVVGEEGFLELSYLTLVNASFNYTFEFSQDFISNPPNWIPTVIDAEACTLIDCSLSFSQSSNLPHISSNLPSYDNLGFVNYTGTMIGCIAEINVNCKSFGKVSGCFDVSGGDILDCHATCTVNAPNAYEDEDAFVNAVDIDVDYLIHGNFLFNCSSTINSTLTHGVLCGVPSGCNVQGLSGGFLSNCVTSINAIVEDYGYVNVYGIIGTDAYNCTSNVSAVGHYLGGDNSVVIGDSTATACAFQVDNAELCEAVSTAEAEGEEGQWAYNYGGFITEAVGFICESETGTFKDCNATVNVSTVNKRESASDWYDVYAVREKSCTFRTSEIGVSFVNCNIESRCDEVLNGTKDCSAYEAEYEGRICADPCYYEYCIKEDVPEERQCTMTGETYLSVTFRLEDVPTNPETGEFLFDTLTATLQITGEGDIDWSGDVSKTVNIMETTEFEFDLSFTSRFAENTVMSERPTLHYVVELNQDVPCTPSSGSLYTNGVVHCEGVSNE